MKYSKKDIQDKLLQIGVVPNLIIMPAVIERLQSEVKSIELLDVDINGNILYKDNYKARKFLLKENGEAISYRGKEPNYNWCDITEINKYGMETKVGLGELDGEINDSEGYSKRINGMMFYQNSDFEILMHNGDWSYSINDTGDWKIPDKGDIKDINYKINNAYMGYIIANYPQTIGWYVENKFLPESEIERNHIISQVIKETADISKNDLEEVNNTKVEGLGFLLSTQEKISPEEKAKRIQNIKQEIDSLYRMSEEYKQGNANYFLKYTQQDAVENRTKYFKDKARTLKVQSGNNEEKIKTLKELTLRCSKIPFVGKRLLKTLDKTNLLLTSGKNEETIIPNSELGNAYMEYKTINDTVQKYLQVSNSIKDCLVNDLGRIPFLGKRIKREVDSIMLDKAKENAETKEGYDR